MGSEVSWNCEICGTENFIEYATDKKVLTCLKCGQVHVVTGLHVIGTPIVHSVAQ